MRPPVQTLSRDDGFTMMELLIATTITLIVLAGAMTTFKNALSVNDIAAQTADSSQNLRAGTNLLVRDLMQTGRGIPTGGIAIPNGDGSTAINRPGPNGSLLQFDNTTDTVIHAVTLGSNLGPSIDGQTTDVITILMDDPVERGDDNSTELQLNPPGAAAPNVQADGSSFNVGANTSWITGDPANGVSPIQPGDLIMFTAGQAVVRTVTSVDATHVYFASGDWFNFNQTGASAGTINQLDVATLGATVKRIYMYTYYVDAHTTPDTPRLARVINNAEPEALAGVVEDLDFTFDFVDGVTNPANQHNIPGGLSANQIRKVNLHVGVRSEQLTLPQHDYMRNHLTTVVSLRSLAFVDRYQ
jgi:prepilin-type N-terminal cleavage/methylation domain-containing protein